MSAHRENRVIAHFLDGSLIRGTTLDFHPTKPTFHITDPSGEVHEVDLRALKALFFVKRLEGDETYRERKGFFDPKNRGKKVMVEFFDGEVVFGYTLTFSTRGYGFFMIPGDPHSNNEKIFVIHGATKRVKVQEKKTMTLR
jgi:hypothetical protein